MNKSTTSNTDDDRPIEYVIKCSDSKGVEQTFIYDQHIAPSSLCRQANLSSNEIKMQISALMFNLITTHDKEVLQARDWSCVQCERPATTIIHNPMSYLHLPKPQIIEFAMPCCEKKSCDRDIRANFAGMMALIGVPNGLL